MLSRVRTFLHRSLLRSFLAVTALCALNAALHAQEVCDNGVDDDADGLIDLNDTTDCRCNASIGAPGPVIPLIANPSFEAYSSMPTWFSEFDRCSSWELGTGGSSDYFVAPSYMPSGVPQPLPDGNACAGAFIITDDQGPGIHYLEYIATCLLQPMQAGEQYSLQFHVAGVMLDLFTYGSVPMNLGPVDITVYGLSTCVPFPVGSGFGCPTGWTVLGQLSYQPTGAWDQVTITLTPPTDINAIMIGGPCQPPADYTGGAAAPYFFYDAFTLNDSTSLATSVARTGSTCTNDVVLHGQANSTATAYQWYYEGVALLGRTDSTLDVSALGLDTGTYQFRASAGGTCAVAEYLLEADPYPVIAATATPATGCVPLQVTFAHGADPALLGTVSWDLGDGTTSTTMAPVHTYTTAGLFAISLTVTSPLGCVADTTYTGMVEAYDRPVADFTSSPYPTDLFRTDISFFDASSADAVQWAWDFGPDGVPGSSHQEFPIVHFPGDAAGTYPVQLVVTNVHGCTDTIIRPVVIDGYYTVYVPNAFTPDGDGVNDTWIPCIADQDERLYQVRVFDRWGEEVWASTDAGMGWNGMRDGAMLKTDVFVWKLETLEAGTSVRHLYMGHVSLLK